MDLSSFEQKRVYTDRLANLVLDHLSSLDPFSYDRFYKLGHDLKDCGTFLQFAVPNIGQAKLYRANFCKSRICPMCNWRRSKALFSQLSSVFNYLGDRYSYYFLTLTIVSHHGDQLKDQLDLLLKSWDLLFHRREVKRFVRGYYRSIEVTYNRYEDWFHPHIHVCLAFDPCVEPPISQASFLKYWQESCSDPSISQVDLRSVYSSNGSPDSIRAALESAKYACKYSDIYFEDDPDLSFRILDTFLDALSGRRLVSFGKVFSEARKALCLHDPESQLTDDVNDLVSYVIQTYHWGSAGCYVVTAEEPVL